MLAQLQSFLAVVEEGSLNRAAARLRLSQPALSRQMQALESEVGGRLLERSSSGVQPTDAGHALAERATVVLAEYEAAIAEARRLARGQKEELRVGFLGSTAQNYINPALAALRAHHPEVKVRLFDYSPGEQIEALRRGEIDLALIGQEGSMAARDFYTRKLATLPVVAILPADHPLAGRRKIRLEELKDERFVRAAERDMPGRDRWVAQLCRQAGFRVKWAQEAESLSEKLSLVSGEGVVALDPVLVRDISVAGVAMVPIADAHATWDFLVVWQRGRTATPTLVFLETLSTTVVGRCKAAAAAAAATATAT